MNKEYVLVLSTCPEGEKALSIAQQLVNEKLAACVNILPKVTSVYPWQGAVQTDSESLLLIKSEKKIYPRLEARLREIHPYELPEIVMVCIEQGFPEYLNWISQWLSSDS